MHGFAISSLSFPQAKTVLVPWEWILEALPPVSAAEPGHQDYPSDEFPYFLALLNLGMKKRQDELKLRCNLSCFSATPTFLTPDFNHFFATKFPAFQPYMLPDSLLQDCHQYARQTQADNCVFEGRSQKFSNPVSPPLPPSKW